MMNSSHDKPRGGPGPDLEAKGRNPAQRTERRQSIIEAAERVFAVSGLDGATMRAIASEAGCTTGGIYPFFDGKDALYAEILQQSLSRMGRALVDALDAAASGREAHSVTHAFFAYYQAHPHELSMGLYLYRNRNGRKGLSNGLDRTLNSMVLKALSAFDRAFLAVVDIDETTAARLRGRAFTYLVGLLILDEARRLKLLGLNVSEELDVFTDTLLYPYTRRSPGT